MKVCLKCHKSWDKEDLITPDSPEFWKGIKTAQLTFCGCCARQMNNEFELQFKKAVLRIEGRKK